MPGTVRHLDFVNDLQNPSRLPSLPHRFDPVVRRRNGTGQQHAALMDLNANPDKEVVTRLQQVVLDL